MKEMNGNNATDLLRDLIDNLSRRELSVGQIVEENTGVISLNDQDCSWIERLSRASLEINDEYFPQSNTQLQFNFLYIQFYIIRSYLLFCRINYRGIHQKYQCCIPQPIEKKITTTGKSVYTLNDPQFVYLQERSVGKLFHEYNLLRKFNELLKRNQDDVSNMNFHHYLRTTDDHSSIIQQMNKCDLPDFELCYIDDVCRLYEQSINNFDYSILNTPSSLHVPIDEQSSSELDRLLREDLIRAHSRETTTDLQAIIRTIADFLNELKEVEDVLLQQSACSLAFICVSVSFDSPIATIIPEKIKGENYIALVIKLIELRSQLQQQTIQKEETNKVKWHNDFGEEPTEPQSPNVFDENFFSASEKEVVVLDVPFNDEQTAAFEQFLNDTFNQVNLENDKQNLEEGIQTITDFLNELQKIEDVLRQQPSSPLVVVCRSDAVQNAMSANIPEEIKCENYRPFVIRLMHMRAQLEEQYKELTDFRRFYVPLNDEQNATLDRFFNDQFLQPFSRETIEEQQVIVKNINDFLDELEDARDIIVPERSSPLATVCEQISIKSPIATQIPEDINCENYMSVVDRFMEIRSQLQEEYEKIVVISVPLNDEQQIALNRFFDENFTQPAFQNSIEAQETVIQSMSVFLDASRNIQDTFRQHSSIPLATVCEEEIVDSQIGVLIPKDIKCENYMPFIDRFVKIRAQLEKRCEEMIDDARLNVVFDDVQKAALDRFFNEHFIQLASQRTIEELQSIIQNITGFLDELRNIKNTLRQHSSLSLATVCEEESVQSPIGALIPKGIKCGNYMPFIDKFTAIQSQLEEERARIALISVPLNDEQQTVLDRFFDEKFVQPASQKIIQEQRSIIETISRFLNGLSGIKDALRLHASVPLATVCEEKTVQSPVGVLIPKEINCENYMSFVDRFLQTRSQLQEEYQKIALISVPLNDEQAAALDRYFNENFIQAASQKTIEELQSIIQNINGFFDRLEGMKDALRQHASVPLATVCEQKRVESPSSVSIPNQIKCENYMAIIDRFAEIRSQLEEERERIAQLSVPLNDEQKIALDQFLTIRFIQPSLQNEIENLETLKQTVTEFLNEIKSVEDKLRQQRSLPLVTVCAQISVNSPLATEIPNEIKCENYFPFATSLIDARLRLEELGVPLNDEQTTALEQFFNDDFLQPSSENDRVDLEDLEQRMDEFLSEFKNNERTFQQRRTLSLATVCEQTLVNSPIAAKIPIVIKCENYIPFVIKMMSLPSLIRPSTGSLFELNVQSTSLTGSNLLGKIREKEQKTKTDLSSVPNLSRFSIIYGDEAPKRIAMRTENIYQRLKIAFEEKGCTSNEFVIVNQDQIFVDFLSTNTTQSSLCLSSEYHIIPRTSLISLILQFQSNEREYFVTSACQLSSIISYSLVNHQLISASTDTLLGFFDELGSYIDEDTTIEHVYRPDSSDSIRIRIIRYEGTSNYLSTVALTFRGRDTQEKLFHPNTQWNRINLWLRTLNTIMESYSFCDREQQIILNEDQTVSSASSTIDGVSDEEIMTVILSYESNEQSIRILKACPIADLLSKEQYRRQLKVQIPASDCILVRKTTTEDTILSEDDLKQSIGNSSSDENEDIHFQIGVLIQIRQYDNNRTISKPIFNRNITIEQILQMITDGNEAYPYLASANSHLVLDPDEQLVNLVETKFDLVKENETCSIIISRTNQDESLSENGQLIQQRYTIFATMGDLYEQNKDMIHDQDLIYNKTIILSSQTPLTYFRSEQSSLLFILSKTNFNANVTITHDEEPNSSLNFRCLRSVVIECLFDLACQLFRVNKKYYRLSGEDEEWDDSMALFELVGDANNIQVKLKSIARVKCSILYEGKTMIIPASETTTALVLIKDTLKKLSITQHPDQYELYLVTGPENLDEIDSTFTMDDIKTCFEIKSTLIPFQLIKKQ